MTNNKEIYLMGPTITREIIDNLDLNNKCTVAYSGNLLLCSENNFCPTYWTFLDPKICDIIYYAYKNKKYDEGWLKALSEKSTIIITDFQGNDKFYEIGFTTEKGKAWNTDTFGENVLPSVMSLFSNKILKTPEIFLNNFDRVYYEDFLQFIVKSSVKNLNIDKLTYYLIPLMLSCFNNIEYLHCVGFGDFSVARKYSGSSKGYDEYKKSYDLIKPHLKKLLEYKNVKVTFNNFEKTIYKELGQPYE